MYLPQWLEEISKNTLRPRLVRVVNSIVELGEGPTPESPAIIAPYNEVIERIASEENKILKDTAFLSSTACSSSSCTAFQKLSEQPVPAWLYGGLTRALKLYYNKSNGAVSFARRQPKQVLGESDVYTTMA